MDRLSVYTYILYIKCVAWRRKKISISICMHEWVLRGVLYGKPYTTSQLISRRKLIKHASRGRSSVYKTISQLASRASAIKIPSNPSYRTTFPPRHHITDIYIYIYCIGYNGCIIIGVSHLALLLLLSLNQLVKHPSVAVPDGAQ